MKPKYPRIGVCGELRAGKDAVAEYLVDQYGFQRLAFADKLREAFHSIYPWIPPLPKPRQGYQEFGQSCRRIDPDVWVRHVIEQLPGLSDRPIVVSDLRQPNELTALREHGFAIVKVTAPVEIRVERARKLGDHFTAAQLEHETEKHVDAFLTDFWLDNRGTIDELHYEVDEIVRTLLGRNG